ncbi:TfoX/Sxy family protein [Maritalea mediterranea]|uniref:TfoX/Sxy family protein n=1 Tax=Maritalea mediterranea TaxID=2909667 RepID=A0ABS9E7D0_9HYPH|nr:TfoX/Sxy family protein [Maritalea mediterranea]MCF4098783.1 TfoX/Sxy family protein [Maritalea mediterranea]
MSEERETLANRIRNIIGDDPNIEEKKMFGGIAFMLNGNMLVGTHKDGTLMARVGPELYEEALSRPGAKVMDFTGKTMKGFIHVHPDKITDDKALRTWIALATEFVGALPPK